jgi:transcriptional regulator with XRE-family HTH domain
MAHGTGRRTINAMTTVQQTHAPAGELLRNWRRRRRRSQLDLALDVGISTRHLSFVETGRSAPSADMVMRLAAELAVPLRERNQLLLAAGFAPVYGETELDAPELAPMREAVRNVLSGHDPFPALAVDRHWNLVDANAGLALFTDGVAPELLAAPANALRLALHPEGMAPKVANLGEWRAHLLGRLRRQGELTADPVLIELYDELVAYPCGDDDVHADPGDVVAPLRLHHDGEVLSFFGIVASFGTPLDITLSELAIESFFPADERTGSVLRARG